MDNYGANKNRVGGWWLEPISWRQSEAIAKHYNMTRQEAELVYPTKGAAVAAINASYFRGALRSCVIDATQGRLTSVDQVRGYFIDDSEGGANNLGNRTIESIWEYLRPYVEMRQKTHPLTTRGGQNLREQAGTSIA